MSGGGSRVSIPGSTRKMIQNIKEITGNHSEEEIYAMLKECSMDPNETAQRLLLQDPFHEVKRKRDKKKENPIRESGDSRWRSGSQGRGARGGRSFFSPRFTSHDAGGGKNSATGRNSGNNQVAEKSVGPSALPSSQETKAKETTPAASPVTAVVNGPSGIVSGSTGVANQPQLGIPPSADENKNPATTSDGQPTLSSSASTSSVVCFSSSDPVLVPSNDSRVSGAVGTIKREVGIHRAPVEPDASPAGSVTTKPQGLVKNELSESSRPSSASRPPSNYSNRSQESSGPQKVGVNKEWKPKTTNPSAAQGSGKAVASEVSNASFEVGARSQSIGLKVLDSDDATSNLQKQLEQLHLPQRQHVIIPNHIHVPESERTKLSFGSFDANFGVTSAYDSGPESDKSSTPVSETSQVVEETEEEPVASNQNTSATAEVGDYPEQPQSLTHAPENLSGDSDVSTSAVPEYNESKQESQLLTGGQQFSVVHTSPNYGFGVVPPMVGSQFASFENSESQARDMSRLPSYLVQPPFDPASIYAAQFYRSGADGDGRVSPFPLPGVATKYNTNIAAVMPPQTSQSAQEGGNSMVLSTAGPTPLVTQAAGLMQTSMAVTQQPVPVFRPPAGMHISHYPPNYITYPHYFSPFYVPPTAIHQYLSNGAFPQQAQAGNVYPTPQAAAAAATGAKYSLPQYKPGNNTGNSAHVAMPSGFGPYGSNPGGYNPSSAATAGNSTANEDLGGAQFKENNVYMTGQQSEGSAVWIAAAGRDMSSLPASSFYNLPPQGQHVTFAPTQATFTGLYHPGQGVTAATVHPLLQQSQTMAGAAEIGGPTANVYQQPHNAQINWPSNY